MKGGNIYSFRGRPISVALALVVLVLFSTLLWTWETNPIATTFRSAQEWYHLPSGLYPSQKYLNACISIYLIFFSLTSHLLLPKDFYFFCNCISLDFHMEVPIHSVGTPKPKKGVEKSLTPSRVNETKLPLGIKGAAAVDSIRPQSPDFIYKKGLKSSSRNEGRIFFLINSITTNCFLLIYKCTSIKLTFLQLVFLAYTSILEFISMMIGFSSHFVLAISGYIVFSLAISLLFFCYIDTGTVPTLGTST